MSVVTVSAQGQVSLPEELRRDLKIKEGDRVQVERDGDHLILRPLSLTHETSDWRSWRGLLQGSRALEEHLEEHRQELRRERLP